MQADRIAFYYDRFLLEADGRVRIQTSDGFEAWGDAFSMDLKLNRFVLAGHVTLKSRNGQAAGAAIADFLDFNRIYFVPVTSEPDRWTFLNNDLANPVKGRIMPGDVFFLPELTGTPSITATEATIGTRTYVRFGDANTYLANLGIPLRSYVVNFSTQQYFAQNSLSGANADLTWNLAGNANSLSALHIRYDKTNGGPYLAFEQHLVGAHDYAVFSINPLTRIQKFVNLQLYEQLGNRFQIQSFTQYFSRYLVDPQAGAQTTYITANQALNHSYVTASSDLTNYNTIGPAGYTQSYGNYLGAENHPSSLQVTWTSFYNRIGDLPLQYQTYVGYGFNHDSVGQLYLDHPADPPGLQSFPPCFVPANGPNGQPVDRPNYPPYVCPGLFTNIVNQVVGYTLSTTPLKFGNLDNFYDTYNINAGVSAQRQWYQVPHYVNTTTFSGSLSRQISRAVGAYIAYNIANTSDLYTVGGYARFVPSAYANTFFTNKCNAAGPEIYPYCDYGYAAFRGASTLRTLNLGINVLPNPDFNFSVLVRRHDDFPNPFPRGDVFQPPLENVIGQPLTLNYLGQPPYDVTPDVRFRILPHMVVDVARTYYFNYNRNGWGQTFIVQVLPQ